MGLLALFKALARSRLWVSNFSAEHCSSISGILTQANGYIGLLEFP